MIKFIIVIKFICLFKRKKTETGFSKRAKSHCPYFLCNLLSFFGLFSGYKNRDNQ